MSDKPLKIGYLTYLDPTNKNCWSGAHHALFSNLAKIENTQVIDIRYRITPTFWGRLYYSLYKRWCKKKGLNYSFGHLDYISRLAATSVDPKLVEEVDIIFAPESTTGVAYLKTDKPIIYFSDTTFASIYGYNPDWSNFSKKNYEEGKQIEQRAFDRASHIILASDWAKDSAINDFEVSKEKLSVVELGANIEDENHPRDKNRTFDPSRQLQIAFFCARWKYKGGDTAIATVNALNQMGIDAHLHLIGVDAPDEHKNNPYITSHGFFNKNKPEEAAMLGALVKSCDILLLPTITECAGFVFCEVSAYGMPIFTHDTGGIPSYVVNGKNGYRLDLSKDGKDFALKIKESLYDNLEYDKLKEGGFEMYATQLNWRVWRERVAKILDKYRK